MRERVSITLSFCEKCGGKVSSRVEVCSNCGTLPYQEDRNFKKENDIPFDSYIDDWSKEVLDKLDVWVEDKTKVNFCKDCGMELGEVSKYDGESEIDDWGHVITPNNHPCNPDSPVFE